MAELRDKARIKLFYNGDQVLEASDVTFTSNAENIPTADLERGFSGFTDGAGQCTISWTSNVPLDGPEHPFQRDTAEKRYSVMQVGCGRLDYVGTGKINTTTLSQSTGASTQLQCEWVGQLKVMK